MMSESSLSPGGEDDVVASDDDVIVLKDNSRQRASTQDGQIPVVHVTPDSPTVPCHSDKMHVVTKADVNERHDKMLPNLDSDAKAYLEKRRHTVVPHPNSNPDGMLEMMEQSRMPMHMPITIPRQGRYSPAMDRLFLYKEQRLPAPSSFQIHPSFQRRASEDAASLAAGIAQFQALRELNIAANPEAPGEPLLGSTKFNPPFSSSPPAPQAGEDHESGSDQEPDPEDVERYLRLRGNRHRHTVAGASEIPPEILTRVGQFPMKVPRRGGRTPSRERVCLVNRDANYVGVPPGMGRYINRRASDGAASLLAFTQHLEKKGKKGSLKEIHAEHLKLQQRFANNGQHDAHKLQQQHQFHQQQHQQHLSPAQQRPQHSLLQHPPFRRLKDPRGRRFSDGPENLAATLAEFNNQLSLSQQKKQLQSIESQHPLTLSSNSPLSPGSRLPTSDYPMNEEMQERNEMLREADHAEPALSKDQLEPLHFENVIQQSPISSPSRPEVYSPASSPGDILNILHHSPSGAQPQEQLQKEMQRLQIEPIGGHLPGANEAYGSLGNNVLLAGQNQNPTLFQGPSSPESFSTPFPGQQHSQGERRFQPESTSTETRNSLQFNNNPSPLAQFHLDQRGDVSPGSEGMTCTDPFVSAGMTQRYQLQQNNVCFNPASTPQDFGKTSTLLQNTNSDQLPRDLESCGRTFAQEQPTGSCPDANSGPINPLSATSVYAASLNAETVNSATVSSSRVGGHHRRHHTVQTSDEARNDLLRQATANNLYKRLPFNNNLINPVTSKEDILVGDGGLPRVLSPKGSIFIDPMIKVDGTNGFNTNSTPDHMKFAFYMNKISHKSVTSILDEVRSTLDNRASSLLYKQSNLLFTLQDGDVQMQIEVCQSPELSVNGLRLRRLGGNTWNYKRLCNELLSGMNL